MKTGNNSPDFEEAAFRTFPLNLYNNGSINLGDIEAYDGRWVYLACPESTAKCPHCRNHVYHIGCLVVGVCGVVSTSSNTPRSAIGIFFGRENKQNLAVELDGDKHTTQTAELKACLEALTRTFVQNTRWQIDPPKNEPCYPLHTLVIKTDSDYLVKGVTEWLPKWKENGWKKTSGHAIANAELWRIIDAILKQLEYDAKVQFWYVPREHNQIATAMAKNVLGET
ncbi:Ribonuclease H1 [Penicillium rolfsii]|nr:Ribonuclease H1 [Penicillium rolfsii]